MQVLNYLNNSAVLLFLDFKKLNYNIENQISEFDLPQQFPGSCYPKGSWEN